MFGKNDRFFSPARDITLLAYPIIRGALTAAHEAKPELTEGLNLCAQVLASYFSKVVVDKAGLKDLLAGLRTELSALSEKGVSEQCRQLVLSEIAYGFLLSFGAGSREATDSEVLSDEQVTAMTEQGLILSALSPGLRQQVEKELKAAYIYERELDRKPLKGEILQEVPDATETGSPAPETSP